MHVLLCEASGIDAIIKATGEIEFGPHFVLQAIKYRKHVVLMNARLDATHPPDPQGLGRQGRVSGMFREH